MGQTEGMVIPRCAASATWNPHVDVKGREDAVDVKGLEDDATETTHGSVDGVEVEGAGKREVGDTRNGGPMVPVWRFTRGGSGTWRQYRVQARDEVGGRAEHMVTPRRAASATWNSQCEEGEERG